MIFDFLDPIFALSTKGYSSYTYLNKNSIKERIPMEVYAPFGSKVSNLNLDQNTLNFHFQVGTRWVKVQNQYRNNISRIWTSNINNNNNNTNNNNLRIFFKICIPLLLYSLSYTIYIHLVKKYPIYNIHINGIHILRWRILSQIV